MKKLLAVFAVVLGLVFSATASHATPVDTLHFVSTSGTVSGGSTIYPYNFSIDGSKDTTSLMCLNFDRVISIGETWAVNIISVPLDNSTTSANYRADAWLFSQMGKYSTSDVQYAVWSIFDPIDVAKNSAFGTQAQQLAATALQMAQSTALMNSGFYTNFHLFIPTSDITGWTYGQPQSFIGTVAATPEPSTLMLMGTAMIGMFFLYRRSAYAV